MRRSWWLVAATVAVVAACSDGGGDAPRQLERIDGPAQLDPEFLEDGGSGGRDGSDG